MSEVKVSNRVKEPAFTLKCGICGKEYHSITDYAKCVQECVTKRTKEEEKAKAEKKAAERKIRKEAVDDAFDRAFRLKDKYIEDYGYYAYSRYESDDDDNESIANDDIYKFIASIFS